MFENYKLIKLNSSNILGPEMPAKYASLGYFHYNYIKTLDLSNSIENLVKDKGVLKRREDSRFREGIYLEVSMADFSVNRKISVLFKHPGDGSAIKVRDLVGIVDYVNSSIKLDGTNSFVKFDLYTIVN